MTERVGINKRIADRLLSEGRIDDTDYTRAIEHARRKNTRVEDALIDLDIVNEQDLLKFIATTHKTQFVSTERMSKAKIDRDALKLVPKGMARHFGVYPLVLDRVNDKLIIATADPDNQQAIDELRVSSRVDRVVPMIARPEAVSAAIDRGYDGDRTRFQRLMQPRVADIADMIFVDPGKPGRQPTPAPTPAAPAPAQQADWSGAVPPAERGRRERHGTGRPLTGEYAPPRRKTGETEFPDALDPRNPELRRPDLGRPDLGRPDLGRPDLGRPDLGADPRNFDPRASDTRGQPARRATGRQPELDHPSNRAAPAPRHGQSTHDAWYEDFDHQRGEYEYGYADRRRAPRPEDYDASRSAPGRHSERDAYERDAQRAPQRRTAEVPLQPYDPHPPHPGHPGASPEGRSQRGTGRGGPEYEYDRPPDRGYGDGRRAPESYGRYDDVPPSDEPPEKLRGPLPRKVSSMFPRPIAALGFGPISTRHAHDQGKGEGVFQSSQFLESLRVLVGLLENDRPDLRGHSTFVARLAGNICERISLPKDQQNAIVIASYLHDLGKMGAHHLTALNVAQDDDCLAAAAKLVKLPQQLMESVSLPELTVATLHAMYERMNGQGIPQQLHAKDIPIGARILAIADSYADLTRNAKNHYNALLAPDQAVDVLRQHAGTVFDANIIGVLEKATGGEKILTDLLANRHRVLIVDPDPEQTMVLQLRLVEQGFDVLVARTTDEARAAIKAREFAMVVSEIDIETQDAGFRLHKEIASGNVNLAWVFLSSRDNRQIAERVFKLGVDDFIAKPVSTEILVAKLTQLVDKQSQRVAPRGVSGSLSEMSLADLVQILWHGRKTCALHLSQGDARGSIHFADGRIVNARWGDAHGEVAFYRLLTLRDNGEFRVDPEFVPSGEHPINASPEALLLEGMRLMDEGQIP